MCDECGVGEERDVLIIIVISSHLFWLIVLYFTAKNQTTCILDVLSQCFS